jgi:hypothetical protein
LIAPHISKQGFQNANTKVFSAEEISERVRVHNGKKDDNQGIGSGKTQPGRCAGTPQIFKIAVPKRREKQALEIAAPNRTIAAKTFPQRTATAASASELIFNTVDPKV